MKEFISIALEGKELPDLPENVLKEIYKSLTNDWYVVSDKCIFALGYSFIVGSLILVGWVEMVKSFLNIPLFALSMFLSVLVPFTCLWVVLVIRCYKKVLLKKDIAQACWKLNDMNPQVTEELFWDIPEFSPAISALQLSLLLLFPLYTLAVCVFPEFDHQFFSLNLFGFWIASAWFSWIIFGIHWIILRKLKGKVNREGK